MPHLRRRTAIQKMHAAKDAFDQHLAGRQEPGHYLSVKDISAGPRRRADGDRPFSRARQAENKANYAWSDAVDRWVLKEGGHIYTEDMIWDQVSVVLCYATSCSASKVFAGMLHVEKNCQGIDIIDVEQIMEIWKEYGLDDDDDDDVKAVIIGTTPQDENNKIIRREEASEDQTIKNHDASGSDANANRISKGHNRDGNKEGKRNAADKIDKGRDGISNIISSATAAVRKQGQVLPPGRHEQSPQPQDQRSMPAGNDLDNDGFEHPSAAIDRTNAIQLTSSGLNYATVGDQPNRRSLIVTLRACLKLEPRALRKRRRPVMQSTSPTGTRAKRPKLVEHTYLDTGEASYGVQPQAKLQSEERTTSPIIARSNRSMTESSNFPSGKSVLKTQAPASRGPDPASSASSDTRKEGGAAIFESSGQDPPLAPTMNIKRLSQEHIQQTILRVSVSNNRPDEAPVSVPMELCLTLASLFKEMLAECGLVGDAASQVHKISTTYTWSKRRHLIRRDKANDWKLFCEDVYRGWVKEGDRFMVERCEIEMYVHLD